MEYLNFLDEFDRYCREITETAAWGGQPEVNVCPCHQPFFFFAYMFCMQCACSLCCVHIQMYFYMTVCVKVINLLVAICTLSFCSLV